MCCGNAGNKIDFAQGKFEPKSASSILQALRLQFTRFGVPSCHEFVMFRLVQNFPPGFFQTGSGAFSAAPSARAFDAMAHPEKDPEHCVQVKRSLISIFWKSRLYLDYSISTDKISRIELAESSLQIWAQPHVKLVLPQA